MGATKFEIEIFEGKKINFNIFQNNVKDTLVQQDILKALKEIKLKDMKEYDWEKMEVKAISTIF